MPNGVKHIRGQSRRPDLTLEMVELLYVLVVCGKPCQTPLWN